MKLTTHLYLVLRLGMHGAIPSLPIHLHGMVLSYEQGHFKIHILVFWVMTLVMW